MYRKKKKENDTEVKSFKLNIYDGEHYIDGGGQNKFLQ